MLSGRTVGSLSTPVTAKPATVKSDVLSLAGCNWWVETRPKEGRISSFVHFAHPSPRCTISLFARVWVTTASAARHSDAKPKQRKLSDGSSSASGGGESQQLARKPVDFQHTMQSSVCDSWGYSDLGTWPSGAHTTATVHWELEVRDATGFRRPPFYTFEAPDNSSAANLQPPNVVFVVGKEARRLYACREVLSVGATGFARQFSNTTAAARAANHYDDEEEEEEMQQTRQQQQQQQQKEIVLEREDPDAFAAFLRYFYHCREPITKDTVRPLARLAHHYDAPFVAALCEQWFTENFDKFTMVEMLRVVDQYGYLELLGKIYDNVTHTQLKTLFATEEWRQLPAELRATILEATYDIADQD